MNDSVLPSPCSTRCSSVGCIGFNAAHNSCPSDSSQSAKDEKKNASNRSPGHRISLFLNKIVSESIVCTSQFMFNNKQKPQKAGTKCYSLPSTIWRNITAVTGTCCQPSEVDISVRNGKRDQLPLTPDSRYQLTENRERRDQVYI